MPFVALTCPQCAAPLPRAAYWRTVTCAYCGVVVGRTHETVRRADFREAQQRVQAGLQHTGREIHCGSLRFRVIAPMGVGEHCDVYQAEKVAAFPERVTLKLARAASPAGLLAREAAALDALQQLHGHGSAYFSQRLPQVSTIGKTSNDEGAQDVLALRMPTGYWGTCADVAAAQPGGIDPRHAVWLWRRTLEVLGYIHGAGWTHGDVIPAHMLVQPRDHGVLLIGWGRARHGGKPAHDLMQSALSIRALPGAGIPAPLDSLLAKASQDESWCARLGAAGIDDALRDAALQAFGPPRFIPFNPTANAVPTA